MAYWYVYIVRCGDNSLYCGVTLNVERRLSEHRSGGARAAKYLRGRGPLHVVYSKRFKSKGEALRAEARIKKFPRRKKESLLRQID